MAKVEYLLEGTVIFHKLHLGSPVDSFCESFKGSSEELNCRVNFLNDEAQRQYHKLDGNCFYVVIHQFINI